MSDVENEESGLPARIQRRHPSEKFILFLLTQGHPEKCDNEWVREQLLTYRLPDATDNYLNGLRKRLLGTLPKPFLPSDRNHRKSMTYLKAFGIHDMHHPTRDVEEANSILLDFPTRRKVENGLLGGVPVNVIAREVARLENVQLTAGGVRAYAHYFWDARAMSMEEWAEIIAQSDTMPLVRDHQLAALRCGRRVAMHHMGILTTLDSQTMLRDAQRRLHNNLVEVDERFSMSPMKVQMLTSLTGSLVSVSKTATSSEQELRKLLKDFERLRTKTDSSPVTPLTDIVAGEGSFSDTADVVDHGDDDEELEDGEADQPQP